MTWCVRTSRLNRSGVTGGDGDPRGSRETRAAIGAERSAVAVAVPAQGAGVARRALAARRG
jgi:hypothetical protein